MPPKRTHIDGAKLGARIKEALADKTDPDSLMAWATELCGEVCGEADAPTKKSKVSTAASHLKDISTTASMFDLEYHPINSEHILTSPKGDNPVEIDNYVLEAYESLWQPCWRMQSAEALCRTPIDILLNNRMGRIVRKESSRNLCLLGEKHMDSKRADKDEFISGDMDYVIGYGGSNFKTDACLVGVVAKRQEDFSGCVAQCIAYLVGLRQKRAESLPRRMVNSVHGFVSDGTQYVFLRLEDRKLCISPTLSIRGAPDSGDFRCCVNLLDHVLESVQASSSYGSPVEKLPEAAYMLDRERGSNVHLDFAGVDRKLEAEYLYVSEDEEDGESEEDEETWLSHSQRTPSKCTLQVKRFLFLHSTGSLEG